MKYLFSGRITQKETSMPKVYGRRSLLAMVLILLSLVGVVAVNRAYAQDRGVPPFAQQILVALSDLKNTLTTGVSDLKGLLSNLQNSVNALSVSSNVRFTAPVNAFGFSSPEATCEVVNVTNATKTINMQVIGRGGVPLSDSGNFDLGPGDTSTIFSFPPAPNTVYCKFTVVGGSRTDIRGSIAVSFSGSVAVVVPAE